MDAQSVTLGVAVLGFMATLSVQLINYLSNLQTKLLDTQERQKDRNQELRKVYVTKKIEAAEAFVSRLVATIDKLDMSRLLVVTANADGAIGGEHYEQLMAIAKQVQDLTNAAILKSGHPYLFFEAKLLEQQTGSVGPEIVRLEGELLRIQTERHQLEELIETEPPSRSKDNIRDSYHANRREYQETLSAYGARLLEHRNYLVSACDAMREALAKYDLAE